MHSDSGVSASVWYHENCFWYHHALVVLGYCMLHHGSGKWWGIYILTWTSLFSIKPFFFMCIYPHWNCTSMLLCKLYSLLGQTLHYQRSIDGLQGLIQPCWMQGELLHNQPLYHTARKFGGKYNLHAQCHTDVYQTAKFKFCNLGSNYQSCHAPMLRAYIIFVLQQLKFSVTATLKIHMYMHVHAATMQAYTNHCAV